MHGQFTYRGITIYTIKMLHLISINTKLDSCTHQNGHIKKSKTSCIGMNIGNGRTFWSLLFGQQLSNF